MSAHPLLTRVIAKAIRAMTDGEMGEFLAIGEVAAIPSDIADRLERALDACAGCGHPRDGHDFTPPNDCHATPTCDCGPYQPLVTP